MQKSEEQPVRDRLSTPIQYVKGVGPKIASLLEKKGIRTVEDALYFLPRAYEDRRNLKKISELGAGRRRQVSVKSFSPALPFSRTGERGFLRRSWAMEPERSR